MNSSVILQALALETAVQYLVAYFYLEINALGDPRWCCPVLSDLITLQPARRKAGGLTGVFMANARGAQPLEPQK